MKEYFSFVKCAICGNVIEDTMGSTANILCCGQKPSLLVPNTIDASQEKHVPVCTVSDGEILVKVGSVEHPMVKEHYIMWIACVAENRITKVMLFPEQATETRFPYVKNCKIYAYCNLHGLWVTEFKG